MKQVYEIKLVSFLANLIMIPVQVS